MNTNPVRSALDLLDAEPSSEFLSALRARLVADGTAVTASTTTQQPSAKAPDTAEEYVMLAPNPNRSGRNRRVQKIVLAAVACAAAVVAIAIIRANQDSGANGGLRDVDSREAAPLGQAAMISADVLVSQPGTAGWEQVNDFALSDYTRETAAINAATPACAQLASFGLAQPTTKSVMVHQDFANGPAPMLHDVWVFATPKDASRAMDAIAGDVFPTCSLKLFDRFTALNRNITAESTSAIWQAPPIAAHGDRQVIIGQTIDYTFLVGGANAQAINAYVQVGRAIAFIDPQYLGDVGPNSNVEKAITASTDALKKVFGH
ncbi:MAG: hypothetical protein ACXVLM_07215 [Ilumatobacteraceae bacterium]